MNIDMRQLPAGEWVAYVDPSAGTKFSVYGLPVGYAWEKCQAALSAAAKLRKLAEEFERIAEQETSNGR